MAYVVSDLLFALFHLPLCNLSMSVVMYMYDNEAIVNFNLKNTGDVFDHGIHFEVIYMVFSTSTFWFIPFYEMVFESLDRVRHLHIGWQKLLRRGSWFTFHEKHLETHDITIKWLDALFESFEDCLWNFNLLSIWIPVTLTFSSAGISISNDIFIWRYFRI